MAVSAIYCTRCHNGSVHRDEQTAGTGARGRPASTTRQELSRTALSLLAHQGYDETTVDDIAAAAGIGRRTFFRYFEAKPDVVWGEFDAELERLATALDDGGDDAPLIDVVRRAVIATNHFGASELGELRIRMALIASSPDLVAHSAVRYEAWCRVVATFAARRMGGTADDLGPQTLARSALGAAMAAFSSWAQTDGDDLVERLDASFRLLAAGFTLSDTGA